MLLADLFDVSRLPWRSARPRLRLQVDPSVCPNSPIVTLSRHCRLGSYTQFLPRDSSKAPPPLPPAVQQQTIPLAPTMGFFDELCPYARELLNLRTEPIASASFTRTSTFPSRPLCSVPTSPNFWLDKPCIDTIVILVVICHLVQEMCIACMSYGREQFRPRTHWSSEDNMCMQERTASVTIDLKPRDTSTSAPLPPHLFFGVLCQACHELFRAHMLHPLAARWEVLGTLFLFRRREQGTLCLPPNQRADSLWKL